MFERDFFSDQSWASLISDLTICNSFFLLFFIKKTGSNQKTGFFVDPAYDPGGVGVKNPDGVGVYIYSGVKTPPGSG